MIQISIQIGLVTTTDGLILTRIDYSKYHVPTLMLVMRKNRLARLRDQLSNLLYFVQLDLQIRFIEHLLFLNNLMLSLIHI